MTFRFNGKDVLLDMAKKAGYKDKFELVAAHTLFVHPDTVAKTQNKALFSIVRDFPNRGSIIDQKMCCDNTGPQHAIEWSIGGMNKKDVQINHIYSDSRNVDIYTALPNLCATPTFIAKLTDTDEDIKNLLKYHSYQMYGFHQGDTPIKPDCYSQLTWMSMIEPLNNLESYLRGRLIRSAKSRTSISAKQIGWFFSDYTPDKHL